MKKTDFLIKKQCFSAVAFLPQTATSSYEMTQGKTNCKLNDAAT